MSAERPECPPWCRNRHIEGCASHLAFDNSLSRHGTVALSQGHFDDAPKIEIVFSDLPSDDGALLPLTWRQSRALAAFLRDVTDLGPSAAGKTRAHHLVESLEWAGRVVEAAERNAKVKHR
jgi:hypothetical protein